MTLEELKRKKSKFLSDSKRKEEKIKELVDVIYKPELNDVKQEIDEPVVDEEEKVNEIELEEQEEEQEKKSNKPENRIYMVTEEIK